MNFLEKLTLETLKVPEEIVALADHLQLLVNRAEKAFSQIEIEQADQLAKARNTEDRLNKVMGKMEKDQQRLLKNIWFDGHAPFFASENDVHKKFLNQEQKEEVDVKKAEFEELRKNAKPKYPMDTCHSRRRGKAMQVYIRGNPANKGEWVARGIPQLLDDQPRPSDPEGRQKAFILSSRPGSGHCFSPESFDSPSHCQSDLAVALREGTGCVFK